MVSPAVVHEVEERRVEQFYAEEGIAKDAAHAFFEITQFHVKLLLSGGGRLRTFDEVGVHSLRAKEVR